MHGSLCSCVWHQLSCLPWQSQSWWHHLSRLLWQSQSYGQTNLVDCVSRQGWSSQTVLCCFSKKRLFSKKTVHISISRNDCERATSKSRMCSTSCQVTACIQSPILTADFEGQQDNIHEGKSPAMQWLYTSWIHTNMNFVMSWHVHKYVYSHFHISKLVFVKTRHIRSMLPFKDQLHKLHRLTTCWLQMKTNMYSWSYAQMTHTGN
jgi:hypothetical protein